MLAIVIASMVFTPAASASESGSLFESGIVAPGRKLYSKVLESPVPYMVGIRTTRTSDNYCSGVLISGDFVLTSNQCHPSLKTPGTDSQWVSIDDVNRATPTNGEQILVKKWFSHPKYSAQNGSYDFMLIELTYFDEFTTPIPLWIAPHTTLPKTSTPLAAYGWNQGGPINTSSVPELKNYMWTSALTILDSSQCGSGVQLSDTEFCAMGGRNVDACRLNEGSPLIQQIAGKDTVVGFVSNRSGCKLTGVATVFSDVGLAYKWIHHQAGI